VATDVLSKSAQEIRKRLAQLEPMVAEHERLKEALAALERVVGADDSPPRGKGSRARRTRPSRTTSAASSRAVAGGSRQSAKRRPSGRRATRADRFVALVEKQPGITVADAAKRLKTTPNSLYQVTSRLRKEGRIRKDGRGFQPPS
jgi:hypothetical protein